MAVFPDIPNPDWGAYKHKALTGTETRTATSGKEWRRRAWPRNKQSFEMSWSQLSDADCATLRAFYDARGGNWESFTFFDFVSRVWTDLGVDEAATGSLDTFTIPAKSTSAHTVYVGGESIDSEYWTIGSGTGDEGEDQIVFDEGHEPAEGAAVNVDCTGQRRYTVRFEGDIEETTTEYGPSMSATIVEVF